MAIALLALMMPFVTISCGDAHEEKEAGKAKLTYTCSMHPQIIRDKPGKCPICGMDLVVFDRNNQDPSLTLSESQRALANITTIVVGDSLLGGYRAVNGRVVTDPSKTVYIASRFAGRMDKMYVRETGVKILAGRPLYMIYSEALSALQQEFMVAFAQAKAFPQDEKFREIEAAARQKLKLYGITDAHINRLSEKKQPDPYVTVFAQVDGFVAELSVQEGQYVNEGDPVMRIEDYRRLWVEGDVYASFASSVTNGQNVEVSIAGDENNLLPGKVSFIAPNLESNSQIQRIRVEISNVKNQWQPGLQAIVRFPVSTKRTSLTVSADALIRDAKGTHLWVETGKGKFVPRMVETGLETAEGVEIKSGIEKGEKVVVTGAYLLSSEYILKKGSNPMAAHEH